MSPAYVSMLYLSPKLAKSDVMRHTKRMASIILRDKGIVQKIHQNGERALPFRIHSKQPGDIFQTVQMTSIQYIAKNTTNALLEKAFRTETDIVRHITLLADDNHKIIKTDTRMTRHLARLAARKEHLEKYGLPKVPGTEDDEEEQTNASTSA